MARTIIDIKAEMGAEFVANTTLRNLYELDVTKTFDEQFSRTSLESIFLYIVAAAIWTLEKLFDTHRTEVDEQIRQLKPHSKRWYENKAMAFRAGQALINGTDTYDNTDLTDEQIAAMQVVKYAAVTEAAATVYIKVAGGTETAKQPIADEELDGLRAYVKEIKDAGVRVELINQPADRMKLSLLVYYNPMVLNGAGEHLGNGSKPVEDAVKNYIENLPFNGEFRTDQLIDRLQAADGVILPELTSAQGSNNGGASYEEIIARATPNAGYYKIYEPTDLTIDYQPYESVSD